MEVLVMKCLCSAQCLDLLQNLVLSGIVTGTSSKPIALHWNPKKVLIMIIYSTEIVCWEYQVIFNPLWTVLWSKVFLFQYLNIWFFFFCARWQNASEELALSFPENPTRGVLKHYTSQWSNKSSLVVVPENEQFQEFLLVFNVMRLPCE